MTVILAASLYSQDTPRPKFSCINSGRNFTCKASNIESYSLLPLWIFGNYSAYGEEFGYVSPKEPRVLEMRVYPDDQSAAPYNSRVYFQALGWVRRCKDKAMFAPYVEGQNAPGCP